MDCSLRSPAASVYRPNCLPNSLGELIGAGVLRVAQDDPAKIKDKNKGKNNVNYPTQAKRRLEWGTLQSLLPCYRLLMLARKSPLARVFPSLSMSSSMASTGG